MNALDLAGLSGKPQRLGGDTEESCRIAQIKPRLDPIWLRAEDWNLGL